MTEVIDDALIGVIKRQGFTGLRYIYYRKITKTSFSRLYRIFWWKTPTKDLQNTVLGYQKDSKFESGIIFRWVDPSLYIVSFVKMTFGCAVFEISDGGVHFRQILSFNSIYFAKTRLFWSRDRILTPPSRLLKCQIRWLFPGMKTKPTTSGQRCPQMLIANSRGQTACDLHWL